MNTQQLPVSQSVNVPAVIPNGAEIVSSKRSEVPTRFVIMHKEPHLDDILSFWLLRKYGSRHFVGIEKATIRFIEKDIVGTDETFDADGVIPVGCCKGRFDEHLANGEKSERMTRECASTLVAKYLGVQDLPELKGLLEEVLHYDQNKGCPPTLLAELTKVSHRGVKHSFYVVNWLLPVIEAIVERVKYGFAPTPKETSLTKLFEGMIEAGFYSKNEKIREYMRKIIKKSEKHCDKITELSFVVQCLFRSLAYGPKEAMEWLRFPLDRIEADQVAFWEEVETLNEVRQISIKAKLDDVNQELKLLVCQKDGLHIQKAARHLGNQLVLVRSSSGNVQIYIDSTVAGLNLSQAVRMIRYLELPASAKRTVDWRCLAQPGKYEGIDHWYYFKKGEILFNGSLTHSAEPTQICTDGLIDVLKHAFHPKMFDTWCRLRQIDTRPINVLPMPEEIQVGQANREVG